MKIIHIVNFFTPKNEKQKNVFKFTKKSILNSINYHKEKYPDIEIEPIAVFYKEDEEIVPKFFKKAPYLEEDAYTKLNMESEIKIKLPFIREIFEKGLSLVKDYDYAVYTNSDIILSPNFYKESIDDMNNLKVDVSSITRRIVPYGNNDLNEIVSGKLDKITKSHPGHDAFVFRKNILEKCDFGDVFIGFPPIGNFILFACNFITNEVFVFENKYTTYHIGEDEDWKNKKLHEYFFKNGKESKKFFFDFHSFHQELKKRNRKKINKLK